MAVLKYFDGNYHFDRFGELDQYTVLGSSTDSQVVLQYDASALGTYDPHGRYAWKVVIDISGGSTQVITDGPHAGETRFTAGTITDIKAYNDSDSLIASLTDMHRSASTTSAYLLTDNGYALQDYLLGGRLKVIGASDSGDPDWNGDNITTGSGHNVVLARGGDDYINDAGGRDVYRGGGGFDTVNYSDSNHIMPGEAHGIVADLAKHKVHGWDGKLDKVYSIEGIEGTIFNDRLLGDKHHNVFSGDAGHDVINGRGGFDEVDMRDRGYLGSASGVSVNLGAGTATDSWGNHDKLRNIEGARGTQYADTFIDSKGANYFNGRDGDDTFTMHRGNDVVQTGAGADTIIFAGAHTGHNTITDFTAGTDVILVNHTTSFSDFTFTDDSGGVAVDWAGGSVYLENVFTADLSASDFGY